MPYSHQELERAAYIAADVLAASAHATCVDMEEELAQLEAELESLQDYLANLKEGSKD